MFGSCLLLDDLPVDFLLDCGDPISLSSSVDGSTGVGSSAGLLPSTDGAVAGFSGVTPKNVTVFFSVKGISPRLDLLLSGM